MAAPPTSAEGVLALLEDRAAFIRSNLWARLLPSPEQLAAFLAALAAATGPWAMSAASPEQRDSLQRMFGALRWDCHSNCPMAGAPPPPPQAVLEELERQCGVLANQLRPSGPQRKRQRQNGHRPAPAARPPAPS
eukprot:COSAG04_NODE_2352_length_4286_cov_6.280153_11_plen_134_part_01